MKKIRKFRKKPVEIEAIQFNGFNFGVINDWMLGITGIHPSNYQETICKKDFIERLRKELTEK